MPFTPKQRAASVMAAVTIGGAGMLGYSIFEERTIGPDFARATACKELEHRHEPCSDEQYTSRDKMIAHDLDQIWGAVIVGIGLLSLSTAGIDTLVEKRKQAQTPSV